MSLASRQESHRLREQVDSTITESANSMWRSWNESNDALRTRIAETTEAHTRLQYHLSRTKQEIYDQEKHVWALKRAIRDKEAPLKVKKYFSIMFKRAFFLIIPIILFYRWLKQGLKPVLIAPKKRLVEMHHTMD